jgi:hypothetical protein
MEGNRYTSASSAAAGPGAAGGHATGVADGRKQGARDPGLVILVRYGDTGCDDNHRQIACGHQHCHIDHDDKHRQRDIAQRRQRTRASRKTAAGKAQAGPAGNESQAAEAGPTVVCAAQGQGRRRPEATRCIGAQPAGAIEQE